MVFVRRSKHYFREHPSERTLAKPKVGIIVSKLTKLHYSFDEYLRLSITDSLTDSDRLPDGDRLYESILNCDGGTENTQLKFIENEKGVRFLEHIKIYIDPFAGHAMRCQPVLYR